jgi:hypothetical protein
MPHMAYACQGTHRRREGARAAWAPVIGVGSLVGAREAQPGDIVGGLVDSGADRAAATFCAKARFRM